MKALIAGGGMSGLRRLAALRLLEPESELFVVGESDEAAKASAGGSVAMQHNTVEAALAERPDVALLGGPVATRLPQALACARAGVPFLVESPLAVGPGALPGVEQLVDEVERRGLVAVMASALRFDPVYAGVRRTLEARRLGRVHAAHFQVSRDPGTSLGSPLLDVLDELDAALWWFGEARRVLVHRSAPGSGGAPDVADLIVEFRSGVAATLHIDGREAVRRRRVSVAGDEARVEGDLGLHEVRLRRPGVADEWLSPGVERDAAPLVEVEHFLSVVRGAMRPRVTLAESVAALELTCAVGEERPVIDVPRRMRALPGGKVAVVVQARMGSTRLPGKVLMGAAGKSMLELLVERLRRARRVERIVIATTDQPADRAIVAEAERLGVDSFCGSEHDVLSRYLGAIRKWDLPAVARITADCPLLDPEVLDACIARFVEKRPDYLSNVHPRSFPKGLDVEVIAREAMERADRQAEDKDDREHVTLYLARHPERFEHAHWIREGDNLAERRWTLDTPADYHFLRTVIEELYARNPAFLTDDVLALLARRPELEKELFAAMQ